MGNSSQKPTIHSAEIEPGKLVEVLQTVNTALPDGDQFCYLMADYWNSQGCFTEYPTGLEELRQQDCISGSAFGGAAELRWRKVGDKLRLVFIAEADLAELSPTVQWKYEQTEVDRCQGPPDSRSILLWGTRYLGDHRWTEARIPRFLSYPSDPEPGGDFEHVRLHFVEYRDGRGRIVIQRRTCVIGHVQRHGS